MLHYKFSKPESESNKGFFQDYYPAYRVLTAVVVLFQAVSFATEAAAGYLLFYPSISRYVGHLVPADKVSGGIALLLSAAIEILIFSILPPAIDAVLNWKSRNRPAELLMKVQILLAAVLVLASGTALSYYGSRAGFSEWGEDIEETEAARQALQAADSSATAKYRADSAAISRQFQQDSIAAEAAAADSYAAIKKRERAERVADYLDTLNNRAGQWRATEARAEEVKAEARRQIAALVREKGERMSQAKKACREEIDTAKAEFDAAINGEASNRAAKGAGLAWAVVAIQFLVIFCQVLRQNFQKGTGIRKVYEPGQYYYSMKNPAYLAYSISRRARLAARRAIEHKVNSKLGQFPGQVNAENLASDEEQPEQGGVIALNRQKFYDPLEREAERKTARAEMNKGKKSYNRLKITAEQAIGAYLQTDDLGQIKTFYEKLAAYIAGREGAQNPFHERRQIGYTLDRKGPAGFPPIVENSAQKLKDGYKPCDNCGNPYLPKVVHQRFCKTECKNEFHSAKHGGEQFNKMYGPMHSGNNKKQ